MLAALGAFLVKIGIGSIASELAAAYRARENAKSDVERVAAEARIARLNAIRDLQIAEAGSRLNASIRAFIALPVALYLVKIFVVDKIACPLLGLPAYACRTDPLDGNLWSVVTAVIGFYFLYEGGVGIARIVKRK